MNYFEIAINFFFSPHFNPGYLLHPAAVSAMLIAILAVRWTKDTATKERIILTASAAFAITLTGVYAFIGFIYAVISYLVTVRLKSGNIKTYNPVGLIAFSLFPMIIIKALEPYYTPFSSFSVNQLTGSLIFPAGISYLLFRGISFQYEIMYDKIENFPSFRKYLLYLLWFPSYGAGPVENAAVFLAQSGKKRDDARAAYLLVGGIIKKISADYLGHYAIQTQGAIPLLLDWYIFAFRFYLEFSGYVSAARGISLYMGYEIMDNFNYPYMSESVQEFWRRWHISLSTHLLDGVFKPIQMAMRDKPKTGTVIALLVTFIICGTWHGPTQTFLLWGILQAGGISVSYLIPAKKRGDSDLMRWVKIIFTFHFAVISWQLFGSSSGAGFFGSLVDLFRAASWSMNAQWPELIPVLLILLLFSVSHILGSKKDIHLIPVLSKVPAILLTLVVIAFITLLYFIPLPEFFPPFYFRF